MQVLAALSFRAMLPDLAVLGQAVDSAAFDEGLRKHMLRVYNYMMVGLAVTGVIAFLVASTPALYAPTFTTLLKWVLMLAPLAFIARVFFITSAMFAATSLRGYTTKTDLSKMGSFLIMGLIGIVIVSIDNDHAIRTDIRWKRQ